MKSKSKEETERRVWGKVQPEEKYLMPMSESDGAGGKLFWMLLLDLMVIHTGFEIRVVKRSIYRDEKRMVIQQDIYALATQSDA
jgi:hypothetical protein